jgi:NADH-quinone oxidoreductase subunit L
MIYVFYGERRAPEAAHESPRVMTWPLVILAICAVGLSVVLTPAWPWLHAYLSGEPAESDIAKLIQPMVFVSLALVAAGIGLSILIYRRSGVTDAFQRMQPGVFGFLENKMWIDEIYGHTVIALSRGAALASSWLDRFFWDGLVRGVGGLGKSLGILSSGVDERGINAGVDETAISARSAGVVLGKLHLGQVQLYLGAIAVAAVALILFYAWLA